MKEIEKVSVDFFLNKTMQKAQKIKQNVWTKFIIMMQSQRKKKHNQETPRIKIAFGFYFAFSINIHFPLH